MAVDPSAPHQFIPSGYDSSICAECGQDDEDPLHNADQMSPQAEDRLERGRRLVADARAKADR